MRDTRTRGTTTLALLGAACAMLLAGCTSGTGGEAPAPLADLQLHPVGDPGRWFSEDYANGLGGRYSTMNTLCGVAEGIAIETMDAPAPDYGTQVQGRRLTDGGLLWTLPGLSCSEGAVQGDAAMLRPGPGERIWRVVDPTSGTALQEFEFADADITSGRAVARIDDVWVLDVEQQLVGVGPTDGGGMGLIWQQELGTRIDVTPLADGMLGVDSGLDGRLWVVDGRSGDVRYESSDIDVSTDLAWASDGFVVRINQSDPEYAFFDLDGEEVDRTAGGSQYAFAPRDYEGVTLPIADHLAAGKVTAVAQDGTPALFEDGGDHFTQAGEIDLRGSSVLVADVSSAGSMIVVDEGEGFAVIDAKGDDVLHWSLPYSGLRVEAGYLIVNDLNVTDVLLPR